MFYANSVKYLEQHPELVRIQNLLHALKLAVTNGDDWQIRKRHVLELGSGCGLVGIASCVLGAERVIMTDLPYTMELMKANVERNGLSRAVECRLCDWLEPPDFESSWRANVVLIADCVWIDDLITPLLTTISSFIESSHGQVCVLISYQRRGKSANDLFWAGMNKLFHEVEKVELNINKPDSLDVYQCKINCHGRQFAAV